MEPRATLGIYDSAEDHYTCYTTSQNPHVARLVMSAFYNVAPENKLRVIAPDVGGGFGSKIYIYPEEIVCLWASKKTGVPVKWTCDRTEAFLTDAHGRDHVSTVKMAFDKDNRITGLKVDTIANLGAYMSLFSSAVPTYLYATLLSGQYAIPAIHANVRTVYTNTVPVDAYRGAGRPEATYLLERTMETAARELGVSPAELRRKNFIRTFPYQTPVIMNYDAGDYEASLEAAMASADWNGFAARKAEAAGRGKKRGIGMSCYIEACGIAPSAAVGSLGAGVGLWESAEVRVNAVGTIEVMTGSHSHGQGHETTFAQLVADRLGIPIDNVNIVHGDTDKVQMGMGTYGSRSGAVGMSAVVKALDKVEAKAKKIAAHLMEADESDIVIENGELKVAGTDKALPWFQVALAAYTAHNLPARHGAGTEGKGLLRSVQLHLPGRLLHLRGRGRSRNGHDRDYPVRRGRRFRQYHQPDDRRGPGAWRHRAGHRPGAARKRPLRSENGQLLTASYMDYAMPRADDLPSFKLSHQNTPCTQQPARHQGLRRGRRDRLAAGADQRHYRCDRQQQPDDARDPAKGMGRTQRRQLRRKRNVCDQLSSRILCSGCGETEIRC
jgi:carbon-monoxide dehydrogenase large subunit